MQRAGELPALPVEAVGQDDAEAKAQRHQLFDDGDGQVRLALGDIALLEAGPGLEDAEEQRKGRRAEHAIGVDRDDAVGERVQVADVLVGGVVGGVPLLAVAGLVDDRG